jgi:hypothetical protein
MIVCQCLLDQVLTHAVSVGKEPLLHTGDQLYVWFALMDISVTGLPEAVILMILKIPVAKTAPAAAVNLVIAMIEVPKSWSSASARYLPAVISNSSPSTASRPSVINCLRCHAGMDHALVGWLVGWSGRGGGGLVGWSGRGGGGGLQ